jgi:hypothetical protein
MEAYRWIALTKHRERAKPFTTEDRDRGLNELDVFRQWFSRNVLASESDLLSNAILIMPFGSGEPQWRDQQSSSVARLLRLTSNTLLIGTTDYLGLSALTALIILPQLCNSPS